MESIPIAGLLRGRRDDGLRVDNRCLRFQIAGQLGMDDGTAGCSGHDGERRMGSALFYGHGLAWHFIINWDVCRRELHQLRLMSTSTTSRHWSGAQAAMGRPAPKCERSASLTQKHCEATDVRPC